MAGTFRWWFLPSWLGLDAPCVVSTWTWAVSQSSGRPWSFRPAAAMFLVVWSIDLSDRLIDVVRCNDWEQATGRLRFGKRYRSLFLVCQSFCLVGILALLLTGLPADVVWRASYVAAGMGVYVGAFVVPVIRRQKLPGKEFGVGLFFALGTYACLGYGAGMLPLLAPEALVVAYNCLVIAARDADSDLANDPGGASRWWRTIKRDLFLSGAALSIAFGLATIVSPQPKFYLAIALAFFALTALHRHAQKFTGDAVRALADFALFTPVVVMGVPYVARISIA